MDFKNSRNEILANSLLEFKRTTPFKKHTNNWIKVELLPKQQPKKLEIPSKKKVDKFNGKIDEKKKVDNFIRTLNESTSNVETSPLKSVYKSENNSQKNILISAISFVNKNKPNSKIYTTYAKRLIDDVVNKTPYDILISTNQVDLFSDVKKTPRIKIRHCDLGSHKTNVYVFNQLLKFFALKDIDTYYDWVLYLDCDSGFTSAINTTDIDQYLADLDSRQIDMAALRTDLTYESAKKEFLTTNHKAKPLLNDKFLFYGIHDEWQGAKFPSEHILLLKNNEKLRLMANIFEKFCYKYETQDPSNIITIDHEAFEIGVSAKLAGYVMTEMTWTRQCNLFKIGFNYNNWEQFKT